MKLDVIIRTCDRQNVSGNRERIIPENRTNMIKKVVDSVIKSCNNSSHEVNIRILDDHSSAECFDILTSLAGKSKVPVNIVALEGIGFNNSAFEQFKAGLESEELVYFVEDDYFHTEDAIQSMVDFYQAAQIISPFNPVAIHPYDCAHRYWNVDSTKLFYHNLRYWRTVKYTSNTLMLHSNTLRVFFPAFEALAKLFPQVTEDDTVNKLLNNMVEHKGPISCFSPIPSVALHMSYQNEAPNKLTTKFTDWEQEWNNYKFN